MALRVPERFRVKTGPLASCEAYGNNGAFIVLLAHGQVVQCIVSDRFGWEHVSVSRQDRVPTWGEMDQVKRLFWGPEDCVVQFHPPESRYVNMHPFCLHLWRPLEAHLPQPPMIMV